MSDFKEFGRMELEGWSEPATASAYVSGFASATEQCAARLAAASTAGSGMDALDLCCGHGVVAKALADTGARVSGLDFSPAMLNLARENVPGVEFIEGDATALPFGDNSFDAITMGFGILHIPNPERALAEVKRVLRPGGRFAYSVWHGPDVSTAFRIVFSSINQHGDPSVSLPPGPEIHVFAEKAYAFSSLENAGFSDPVLETVNSHWTVDEAGAPVDYFMDGTVRGTALLRAQPKENLAAIRSAVSEAVLDELGSNGPWTIPIPAAIVSAKA
jgi:ubiquinone/menaquinone biosynthesis C-methylase UbiE